MLPNPASRRVATSPTIRRILRTAMKLVRPLLISNDRQIIADASADLEKRRAFQEQFEADVRKLQKPLNEATRPLGQIDVVLERIKRLR